MATVGSLPKDLVNSLSLEAILMSLERFVSTVGRPDRIYSHNGTNFVATAGLLKGFTQNELQVRARVKEIA